MPVFEKIITRAYSDVDRQEGVNTEQFLEATTSLVNMFDLFGSSAFLVVQNDMKNNVQKINTRYQQDTLENETLEKLMANEASLKTRPATEAVLWLKRGLEFTGQSLMHSLLHPEDELTVSFMQAYDVTLRPYHSFFVRPLFNLAMNACPWRKDFYENIGVTDKESVEKMKGWLEGLEGVLEQVNRVFGEHPGYAKH
ncbi:glycolipid transfer protein domain-containing protein [Sporodiniella umbellata]|nr:glycolipid transfer protein domain-containing protein [Sporodiniella umbellata]